MGFPTCFSLEFHVFHVFSIGFDGFVMFVGLIGPYWNSQSFIPVLHQNFMFFHVFLCFFLFSRIILFETLCKSYLLFNGRYRGSLFMFFHVCACIFMFVDLLVYCLKTSFLHLRKTVFSLITLTKINQKVDLLLLKTRFCHLYSKKDIIKHITRIEIRPFRLKRSLKWLLQLKSAYNTY